MECERCGHDKMCRAEKEMYDELAAFYYWLFTLAPRLINKIFRKEVFKVW
jgi:hypothetical protein